MVDTLSSLRDVTGRLLETVRALPEGAQRVPSLCAGWTRGHVLTHLARNADGLVNLCTWARTGVETPMYGPGTARDDAIEAGAGRPVAELVADVTGSAARLDAAYAGIGPQHDLVPLRLRNGRLVHATRLADLRLREVAYHLADLDAGVGFADLPAPLVASFLAEEVARLRANPEAPGITLEPDGGARHVVGDGAAYVRGASAALLGWLARGLTAGVAGDLPTLPFGG
jgi:maleylpyruvate isomerase